MPPPSRLSTLKRLRLAVALVPAGLLTILASQPPSKRRATACRDPSQYVLNFCYASTALRRRSLLDSLHGSSHAYAKSLLGGAALPALRSTSKLPTALAAGVLFTTSVAKATSRCIPIAALKRCATPIQLRWYS